MREDPLDKLVHAARQKKARRDPRVQFIFVLAGIFLTWIYWGNSVTDWAIWAGAGGLSDTDTPILTKTAGSWGDSFGAFNALFGAFGFAAVSITLFLQFKANEQQRIDLHIQRLEATFFELIRLMRELRSEICYKTSSFAPSSLPIHKRTSQEEFGASAIKFAYIELAEIIDVHLKRNKSISRQQIGVAYVKCFHKRYGYLFSPYFRIIYSILNQIETDEILTSKQKYYYGRILRAQLSSPEIALLGFNSCAKISKDLNERIKFFRMLKYLPNNTAKRALMKVYDPYVFSARD